MTDSSFKGDHGSSQVVCVLVNLVDLLIVLQLLLCALEVAYLSITHAFGQVSPVFVQ